jgi:hypothetical protein
MEIFQGQTEKGMKDKQGSRQKKRGLEKFSKPLIVLVAGRGFEPPTFGL